METNKLTDKLVQWVESAAQKVGDFATTEIPPFVHEYLTWKFWEAGVNVFTWAACTLGFISIWSMWWKKRKKEIIDGDTEAVVFAFGGVFSITAIIIAGIMFAFPSAKDMIQIKIAPKVYLVEKISEIIKENKN